MSSKFPWLEQAADARVGTSVTLGSAGAVTVDASTGKHFTVTLNATPSSFAITNLAAGQTVRVAYVQGTGGPYTLSPIPTAINGGTTITAVTPGKVAGPTPITQLAGAIDVWDYYLIANGTALVCVPWASNVG